MLDYKLDKEYVGDKLHLLTTNAFKTPGPKYIDSRQIPPQTYPLTLSCPIFLVKPLLTEELCTVSLNRLRPGMKLLLRGSEKLSTPGIFYKLHYPCLFLVRQF